MQILPLFAAMLLMQTSLSAQNLTAAEIIRKSEDHMRGKTLQGQMLIKTVRPSYSREMEMKIWSKGDDFALIYILSPAREKGITYLKRKKEIWNWIPALERNIKLPPSMMAQSWMGTDFTNDDLVRESSITTDYNHRLLGNEILLGRNCSKIELIPKPDAAVVWSKVYLWIDLQDFLQLKTESYDEDGALVNTMICTRISDLGGRTMPTEHSLIPSDKPGNKTFIIYKSLLFDEPISDEFFSTQNMKSAK